MMYPCVRQAKTGFSGNAPFLQALYSTLGSSYTIALSVASLQLYVGGPVPVAGQYQAKAAFNPVSSGGRTVNIIAVNGVACSITASVDTGNGGFLSYASTNYGGVTTSALSAAKKFPFNLTFEGGSTMSFTSAPMVGGSTTVAFAYSKDVLALGFLAAYTVVFDDANSVVYWV